MKFSTLKFLIISLLLASSVIWIMCSQKPEQPEQVVLAKVGDRIITLDEFIKRAEYTIRPDYVKGDDYVTKKNILNSLIAEKLFALEAGTENALYQNDDFKNYIQGRQEQAMRKWLFRKEGMEKVNLDTAKVKKAFRWAGRNYMVEYFSVPTKHMADSVKLWLDDPEYSMTDIFHKIGGQDTLPTHRVSWQKEDSDNIINALYFDSLKVGDIIGPVKVEDGFYTTMRVKDWDENIAITNEQIKMRWHEVTDRIKRIEGQEIYRNFALDVMSGKRVEFERDTFFKLVDLVKPFYMISEEEKRQAFNTRYWQEGKPELTFEEVEGSFDDIKDKPILTIDGETWTVERLRNEIALHPLVFRKRNFSDRTFPKQLKLAIVDLIRDKYLTKEAYKRGFDKVNFVEQDKLMWQDQAMALFHQKQYLRAAGCSTNFRKQPMKVIDDYLNDYVDSLQTKYSDQIKVNMDIFKKVELTHIDMFVVDKNVPYPIKVPKFPMLTTDNRLDYGQEMTH